MTTPEPRGRLSWMHDGDEPVVYGIPFLQPILKWIRLLNFYDEWLAKRTYYP